MRDIPIIFSAPMIRALLDSRKTQTRRIITKRAALDAVEAFGPKFLLLPGNADLIRYAVGDRLWVRENFEIQGLYTDGVRAVYEASRSRGGSESISMVPVPTGTRVPVCPGKLRPSIHMPRWASRLTLIVEGVKVERLQDISEEDAVAEGIERLSVADLPDSAIADPDDDPVEVADFRANEPFLFRNPLPSLPRGLQTSTRARPLFRMLWDSINGSDAWDANPWVVAISFRVERANIDALKVAA